MKTCYFCGAELSVGGMVGRNEVCPNCHRDIRCCFNCEFYDAIVDYCREPQSEKVSDRERSNSCDFFTVAKERVIKGNGSRLEKAREEWEKLFKK